MKREKKSQSHFCSVVPSVHFQNTKCILMHLHHEIHKIYQQNILMQCFPQYGSTIIQRKCGSCSIGGTLTHFIYNHSGSSSLEGIYTTYCQVSGSSLQLEYVK